MPERREVPWWGALLLPLFAIASSLLIVLVVTWLRSAARGGAAQDSLAAVQNDPLNLGLVQLASFGAAIAVGVAMFHGHAGLREALFVRAVPVRTAIYAAVAGLALQLPLAEIGNLVLELYPMSLEEQLARHRMLSPDGAVGAVAVVVGVVAIAPLTEELLFRGLLLPGMARRHGATFAVVLTSAAFGLVHMEPSAVVPATLAGLLLGALSLRTRSVLPAVALHAGVNAVPLLLPERLVRIDGFNTLGTDVYHLSPPLLVASAMVACAALLAVASSVDAADA